MSKTGGQFIGILVGLLLSAGCGRVIYADGPYHGKVIDKETKQPIEGAAVLAVWWRGEPAPHPIITFYDAQDTVTDEEGNFTIRGIVGGSVNPLVKIREPLFTIFKPGYRAVKQGRFSSPGEEGRRVVELNPLKTREERIDNLSGLLARACAPDRKRFCVPEDKFVNLLRLMNIEEKSLGLKPTYLRKGDTQ